MDRKLHIKFLVTVTAVWFAFWLGGLPDYYRQYSFMFMLVMDVLLLLPIGAVIYLLIKKEKGNKIHLALWLSFYFTVPFFIYDYLYCGIYLNHGLEFMVSYWYLTFYYVAPWVLCVPMGIWLQRDPDNGIKKKWIETIYKVATGSRKVRNFFTPVGALFYGLLVFLFVYVALKVDTLLGLPAFFDKPDNILFSLPLFGLATLLIGWSVSNFLKVKGTPVPINPPPKLVTTGPYAYSRNPMLTGVFALMFGFGVSFGSICTIFIFTPLFIYINYWELKAIEEPELEKRLGREYVEYRRSTPMFFPGPGILLKRRQ